MHITMTMAFRIPYHVVVIASLATCVVQSADLIPFLSWEDLTSPVYKLWGFGFPPNTTLSTLLPNLPGIDDYFHELLYVRAHGDIDDFWVKVSEAYADGHLVYDPQLISVAYVFYACRALRGRLEFCPSPCNSEPCAGFECTPTGTGLFNNNYRCQCPVHHHWHPMRLRCVFCGEDFRWNEARLACEIIQQRYDVNQLLRDPDDTTNVATAARWEAWSAWSDCSNTCGDGEQVRRRSCSGRGPSACVGLATTKQACRGESSCYSKPLVYTAMLLTIVGFGVAIVAVTMGQSDDPALSENDIEKAKKERQKRRKKKKKQLPKKRKETMREASARRATIRRETIRRATLRPESIRRATMRPESIRRATLRPDSIRRATMRSESIRRATLRSESIRRATLRPESIRRATIRPESIQRATMRRPTMNPNLTTKSILRKQTTRSYRPH